MITTKQLAAVKGKIREHYNLSCFPTDSEAQAEVASLKHKQENGNLGDLEERLLIRLETGKDQIKVREL
jgi:hypothetical protein